MGTNEQIWKALWKIKVQGAVKHFMWRACHDTLSKRLNLFKRNIIDQSVYPICEQGQESLTHTLWECSIASDIWDEKDSPLKKWATNTQNKKELWVDIFEHLHLKTKNFVPLF